MPKPLQRLALTRFCCRKTFFNALLQMFSSSISEEEIRFRQSERALQAAKQRIGFFQPLLLLLIGLTGILQHHDAITGTCSDDVARDYIQMAKEAICLTAKAIDISVSVQNSKVPKVKFQTITVVFF